MMFPKILVVIWAAAPVLAASQLPFHEASSTTSTFPAPGATVRQRTQERGVTRPSSFNYRYRVMAHDTGDEKSHQEALENGVLVGSYSVVQPDGTLRIVTYRADKHSGFRANVHFQEGYADPFVQRQVRPTATTASSTTDSAPRVAPVPASTVGVPSVGSRTVDSGSNDATSGSAFRISHGVGSGQVRNNAAFTSRFSVGSSRLRGTAALQAPSFVSQSSKSDVGVPDDSQTVISTKDSDAQARQSSHLLREKVAGSKARQSSFLHTGTSASQRQRDSTPQGGTSASQRQQDSIPLDGTSASQRQRDPILLSGTSASQRQQDSIPVGGTSASQRLRDSTSQGGTSASEIQRGSTLQSGTSGSQPQQGSTFHTGSFVSQSLQDSAPRNKNSGPKSRRNFTSRSGTSRFGAQLGSAPLSETSGSKAQQVSSPFSRTSATDVQQSSTPLSEASNSNTQQGSSPLNGASGSEAQQGLSLHIGTSGSETQQSSTLRGGSDAQQGSRLLGTSGSKAQQGSRLHSGTSGSQAQHDSALSSSDPRIPGFSNTKDTLFTTGSTDLSSSSSLSTAENSGGVSSVSQRSSPAGRVALSAPKFPFQTTRATQQLGGSSHSADVSQGVGFSEPATNQTSSSSGRDASFSPKDQVESFPNSGQSQRELPTSNDISSSSFSSSSFSSSTPSSTSPSADEKSTVLQLSTAADSFPSALTHDLISGSLFITNENLDGIDAVQLARHGFGGQSFVYRLVAVPVRQ